MNAFNFDSFLFIYSSIYFSTIEATREMESKGAQAIEKILLRVQKLQNVESFADIMGEVLVSIAKSDLSLRFAITYVLISSFIAQEPFRITTPSNSTKKFIHE